VQRRLGHSKPSITLDIYTHLWPDDEDTTRAAVEAVLGDVLALCPPARSFFRIVQVGPLAQR